MELNGKYGFLDKTGKIVIPVQYKSVDDFEKGLAEVRLNGKSGAINKKGQVVIPIKYDVVSSLGEDNLIWVKLYGKWGLLKISKF